MNHHRAKAVASAGAAARDRARVGRRRGGGPPRAAGHVAPDRLEAAHDREVLADFSAERPSRHSALVRLLTLSSAISVGQWAIFRGPSCLGLILVFLL